MTSPADENIRVRRLEEKIAYLERHVTEQDKAMLELGDEFTRLKRELKTLRDRLQVRDPGEGGELPHERPPHY
jgi:SlyX protein